ncbi:AAA domain-containing protein [bacterium]|nr:AAA domain-containing protein [bacterium]
MLVAITTIAILALIGLVLMVAMFVSSYRHNLAQEKRMLAAQEAAQAGDGGDDEDGPPPLATTLLVRTRELAEPLARLEHLVEVEAFAEVAAAASTLDDEALIRLAHDQDATAGCLGFAGIAAKGEAFGALDRVYPLLPHAPIPVVWYGLRAIAACAPADDAAAGRVLLHWAREHEEMAAFASIAAFIDQVHAFLDWRAERGDPFEFAADDAGGIPPERLRELPRILARIDTGPSRRLRASFTARFARDGDVPMVSSEAESEEPQTDAEVDVGAIDPAPALDDLGRIWRRGHLPPGEPIVATPALDEAVDRLERSLTSGTPRPCLIVGEPGTGRRTVARALIGRLAGRTWTIVEAGHADLIADQKYVGMFEARLRLYVAALGRPKRVWYAPEFAGLEFTGRHEMSPRSAIDLLLPHLEAGLPLVGVVTGSAWQRLQRTWPALRDAVHVVEVAPAAEPETLALVGRWLARRLEVDTLPDATGGMLAEAQRLAGQFLRDRAAPGNLFALMIRVLRRREGERATDPAAPITRDEVLAALGDLTSLPRFLIDDRERFDATRMRAFFAERILGQAEAVECLVQRVALVKAGLTDPDRPQGVFLFAGPTGTGKTEIAKTLAAYLFGSPDRLARLDMSEYATPGSAQRLLHEPAPGEVQRHDSLAARIRRQPFSVVLLDEFEKAASDVWNLFLQVFDDGRLTDARGVTTDFRHTMIIMTSNLGTAGGGARVGFSRAGGDFRPTDVRRAMDRAFPPEFRNRIDRTVVFKPFTREVMRELLELELARADRRRGLRHRDWAVIWDAAAVEYLLDRGFTADLGARPLRRAVERHLLEPLAELIASGRIPTGDQFVFVEVRDGRLATRFVDPDADEERALAPDAPTDAAPVGEVTIGGIVVEPRGTEAELATLRAAHQHLVESVARDDWSARKDSAMAAASRDGFWDDPGRFAVLDVIERCDRLEHAVGSADQLLGRLERMAGPVAAKRRAGLPRDLVARLADLLRLLDLARESLLAGEPWDAYLQVDVEGTPQAAGAGDWPDRLVAMYSEWAQRRRMRLEVLEDATASTGKGRRWLAVVSGLAAWTLLRGEDGQHVWEEPDDGAEKARRQARVRVIGAEVDGDEPHRVARRRLGAPSPESLRLVRIYRAEPDPLVRDRIAGWRSGRLDRVLAGGFDVEGAVR